MYVRCARVPTARPFVLETYTSRHRLAANTQVIFGELVPIGLVALLLFSLVTLPLAVSLARHVDRGHRHRAELLRSLVACLAPERRRIASDLHDGLVQDLAAVGYALPRGLVPAAGGTAGPGDRRGLSAVIVESITSLRGADGRPAPFRPRDAGLVPSHRRPGVRDPGAGSSRSPWTSHPSLRLDRDTERLVHRVVREGLRNVVKHAGARTVEVSRAGLRDQRWRSASPTTDGVRAPRPADADRHVGLELLAATVREVGGDLTLEPGTVRRALLGGRAAVRALGRLIAAGGT